jgi:hypothetical protein
MVFLIKYKGLFMKTTTTLILAIILCSPVYSPKPHAQISESAPSPELCQVINKYIRQIEAIHETYRDPKDPTREEKNKEAILEAKLNLKQFDFKERGYRDQRLDDLIYVYHMLAISGVFGNKDQAKLQEDLSRVKKAKETLLEGCNK